MDGAKDTVMSDIGIPAIDKTIDDVYGAGRENVSGILDRTGFEGKLGPEGPFDETALDILKERNLALVEGLLDDARKDILTHLSEGMAEGKSIIEMEREIRELIEETYANRAETIARTEISYAENTATINRYREEGVKKVQFLAAKDERTCDECSSLEGEVFDIDDAPVIPIHPNCMLPDTRCETPCGVVSGLRAFYTGDVIDITTSHGARITVTPNHMFLTPNGFAPAHLLREGDDIFHCTDTKWKLLVAPDDNNGIPTIQKIVSSLPENFGMFTTRVPVSTEYLHGDGRFCDGNIHVIFPNSFLSNGVKSSFSKNIPQGEFCTSVTDRGFLSGDSDLASDLFILSFTADGGMSSIRQAAPFFRGRLGHSKKHRITPVPGGDTVFCQSTNDNIPTNTKYNTEFLDGCSRLKHINNFSLVQLNSPGFGRFSKCVKSSVGGHHVPSGNTNFMQVSQLNPCINKNISNCCGTGAIHFTDTSDGMTGRIQIDYITDIRIRKYSGHVYDLQTNSTLYIANSFIVSNCRCRYITVPGDDSDEEPFTDEELEAMRNEEFLE